MKKLLAFLLLGCMLLLAVGCGNKQEAPETDPTETSASPAVTDPPTAKTFAGTWSGSYTYNGRDITIYLAIGDDYSFLKETYVNGVLETTETGVYTIDKGDVLLDPIDDEFFTRYKYENGALVNNNHPLYREN